MESFSSLLLENTVLSCWWACSCLRPMKTLVLWELFVFDDAEAVAAILTPRIKSSIESDLLNPGDLLTVSPHLSVEWINSIGLV